MNGNKEKIHWVDYVILVVWWSHYDQNTVERAIDVLKCLIIIVLIFITVLDTIIGKYYNMYSPHWWYNVASSGVDHGLNPRSGQNIDYKIGVCCFPANHAVLKSKNKDGSSKNQDNVCEWSDMSTCRLILL